MNRITLFTWGYWGWGNSAGKFIEATNAVEASRGFAPPISDSFVPGPASFQVSQWYLPVLDLDDDVGKWRKENGYAAQTSR